MRDANAEVSIEAESVGRIAHKVSLEETRSSDGSIVSYGDWRWGVRLEQGGIGAGV